MMKRKYLSILTFALTALLLVCALSFTVSAEEATTPTVSIDKFNLVFEDNVYLKYAVKFDGIEDADITAENIGMLYFSAPCDDYTVGNESYSSSVVGHTIIDEQKYYTFEYRHVTAKQMTEYVYSIAYIDIGGVRYYSAPVKYSVLDYCYSKLGKTGVASDNEKYIKLLTATLEQGAAAQEYFDYNTDRLANAEYYLVEVVGGTLEDGFTKGLYISTDIVTLTAPETSGELVFAEWQNSSGESVSTSNVAEITGFTKNDTYTAVYKESVKYSKGLAFTSNGDGTCYVSGIGTCTDTKIVIPPTSPDRDIVTGIGDYAFYHQPFLTEIILTDGVTSIGTDAFFYCKSLTNMVIPDGVMNIGSGAFSDCTSLTNIEIPDSVTCIGGYAFSNCSSLKSIKIPAGVTSIDNYTFYGCGALAEILIPDSVTSIADYAFSGCSSLAKIYYTGNENQWYTIEINYIYNAETFNFNTIYYYLQSTPTANGNFWCYDEQGGIDILSEYDPSKYSHGLYFAPNSDGTCMATGIGTCTDTDILIPPVSPSGQIVTSIMDGAFENCSSLTSIEITEGVISIGKYAFEGCTSLESIKIPDSVTSIGISAFSGCISLESIIIPDSVTSIGGDAFYNCKSITKIEIPDGVTIIDNYTFDSCSSLTEIVIPDSVTSIGECAFYGCNSLSDVYYTGNEEQWLAITIDSHYNDALKNATIHYNYIPEE